MGHTLTIVLSEDVYRGLSARVGESGIGRYIEDLVQRQMSEDLSLEEEYRQAARDEAAEREAQRVHFTAEQFVSVVCKLRREHGSQWVGLAILAEPPEQPEIIGEVIALGHSQSLVLHKIAEYQALHPGTPVRFFTTELAMTPATDA